MKVGIEVMVLVVEIVAARAAAKRVVVVITDSVMTAGIRRSSTLMKPAATAVLPMTMVLTAEAAQGMVTMADAHTAVDKDLKLARMSGHPAKVAMNFEVPAVITAMAPAAGLQAVTMVAGTGPEGEVAHICRLPATVKTEVKAATLQGVTAAAVKIAEIVTSRQRAEVGIPDVGKAFGSLAMPSRNAETRVAAERLAALCCFCPDADQAKPAGDITGTNCQNSAWCPPQSKKQQGGGSMFKGVVACFVGRSTEVLMT